MSPVDKCVILARGLGTRMRADTGDATLDAGQSAAAAAGLKAMIPFGRPFLDYALSALADAGVKQACLVIGPEHTIVREHYGGDHRPSRIAVSFATQAEAIGTANAVLAAESFADRDEFLTVNGDNYYPSGVLRQLRELDRPGTVLFEADALVRESNIPPERIGEFADAVVDEAGCLVDLIEKPGRAADLSGQRDRARVSAPRRSEGLSDPRSAAGPRLVSMNCWRFGPEIFAACRDVPLSPRGEFELPLAVKLAIQRGMRLRAAVSRAGVLDLSRRSDIAGVAERLRGVKVEL